MCFLKWKIGMATSLFKIKTDPIQAMSRHVTSSDFRTPLSLSLHTCISPYSARIWENVDQNNSEYRHFLRSGLIVGLIYFIFILFVFVVFCLFLCFCLFCFCFCWPVCWCYLSSLCRCCHCYVLLFFVFFVVFFLFHFAFVFFFFPRRKCSALQFTLIHKTNF